MMTETVQLTRRPDHAPEALVYPFDIFRDEKLLSDPHARVLEILQEAPPVFWTPYNGGHWVALRYADVHRMAREPETFSSAPLSPERMAAILAQLPPGAPRPLQLTPILMDPPDHTKYRAPLQKAFSPKTVMGLKDEIDSLAESLIGAVAADGGCDFIPAVAEQFPVRVFLKMMGLPADRLIEFRALAREVFEPHGNDPAVQAMRLRKIANAMSGEIQARRAEPKDDLISLLWSLELDGEAMSLDLMEDYAVLLFLAGLDTVINAIGFGMRHLANNPALQSELRANPKLIPEATEEFLRRYTFTISQRRLTRDAQVGEAQVKEGETIYLYMPAADLDAAMFPQPESFEVMRENNVHLAFGGGVHRCLGSHLARIELQAIYGVALEKLPPFRLDPEKKAVFHVGNILAVASLPLRWD